MSANLHARGITIADADSRGGSATGILACSAGTINFTVGDSGVVRDSLNNIATITFHGTIKQIDNLFRGRTSGFIVYTKLTVGSVVFTLMITDEDGLASSVSFNGTVSDFASPIIAVPGGTVNINSSELSTLHGLGFTVTDSDDTGEYATLVIGVNHGTLTISPGNSGTTVTTGNGTNSITVVGTIPKLNGLLAGSGTGLFRHTPTTVNTTITLTVTDSQGQVGTNNKTLTVGVRPTITSPSVYLAATSNVNFNVHGKGFSFVDSDASGAGQTMVLATQAGGTITIAGTSGISSITGSGGASVSMTGTVTNLSNLLSGANGTIVYKRVLDSSTATFTVTVTDDTGRVGTGSVSIITQTGTTWTGYATATPVAATATLNNYVGVIDLSTMPASWWTTVSQDGRDIRATLADNTVLPRHLRRFDKTNHLGQLYVKFNHAASPPALRVWVGASNATAPAAGDAAGQYAVYDSATFRAWWPDGGGADSTNYANTLTMSNATSGDSTATVGVATQYVGSSSGYGKTEVSAANDIPEVLMCMTKPASIGSAMTYVSSVHGTVRCMLGQNNNKVRAKTDIQSGTDNSASATGNLVAGSWQLAAAAFLTTTSRAGYRDGANFGSDTGTSAGAAGTDGYIIGGLGTDTGAAITVNPDLNGFISQAFVLTVNTNVASWVAAYKNLFNQSAYWGAWTWVADTVAGL